MPAYKIIQADKDQYRELAEPGRLDFPGGIFYLPDFLILASEILKLEFTPFICLKDGNPVGLANLLTGGKFKVKTAMIPPLFQYYGPVSLVDEPNIIGAFCEFFKDKFDAAIFSLPPEQTPDFIPAPWRVKNRLTYYLRPDCFDNMMKRCFHSVRKQVNKSIKAGAEFRVENEFQPSIFKASFDRRKFKPPLDIAVLTNWVCRLTSLGLAETYLAVVDGKPAAFRTQLTLGRFAYDWLAGSYPDYLNIGINNFLVLKIGERFYHKGIRGWDLLGGDIESIGNFKKTFGSETKNHLQLEREFNRMGKFYRFLMELKARLHG